MAPHRGIARQVVDDVDRHLASNFGMRLRLTASENVRAGFGRPQSLINPAVDSCNVFIGVLGKRWGRPTGEADSGFQEEYERAVKRHRDGDDIEILVYPSRMQPEDLEDPGEQLKQILTFRDRLYASALIKEHTTPDEFGRLLETDLMSIIAERAAEGVKEPQSQALATPLAQSGDVVTLTSTPPPVPTTAALNQIDAVLLSAQEAVRETEGSSAPNLEGFEVARLHLLATALASRQTSQDPLTVHQANAIFRYRDEFHLQPTEAELVLRTMARHSDLVPGWRIVNDLTDALERLARLAAVDPQDEVRAGALRFFNLDALSELPGREVDVPGVVRYLAGGNGSHNARKELVRLVARSGLADAFELLEELAKEGEPAAEDADRAIVARQLNDGAADDAFLRVVETKPALGAGDTLVTQLASAASTATLLDCLDATDRELKVAAVEELRDRQALDRDAAFRLLTENSLSVRVAAWEALCLSGADVNEAMLREQIDTKSKQSVGERELIRRARLAWLRTLPEEDLTADLNWARLSTADIYQVLAEDRFDSFGPQLRRDLGDSFATFRAESLRRFEDDIVRDVVHAIERDPATPAVPGTGEVETMARDRAGSQLRDFLGEEKYHLPLFAAAALHGIRLHGDPTDAALVRPWLEDETDAFLTREVAIQALARVGDSGDAALLVRVATASYGPEAEMAAQAALALNGSVTAGELLESGPELAVIAAHHMVESEGPVQPEELWRLLNHSFSDVRLVGAAYAAEHQTRDDLESRLTAYMAQPTYYYNVVVILDRALYAPQWLDTTRSGIE
jgi:hypothetical protein